jgi:cyclopropane-fatty-acyl-phospholipid synthase
VRHDQVCNQSVRQSAQWQVSGCAKESVGLFSLEHRKAAYRADFALHGIAVTLLAGYLLLDGPHERWPAIVACVVPGLAAWTAIDYAVHRFVFVLHGLYPFRCRHAEHHDRPAALISAPTDSSARR